MSFSNLQKAAIIEEGIDSFCCRRSFVSGVLYAKADVHSDLISFSLQTQEYADFVSGYIKEIYGKEATVSAPKSGGRCKIVTFSSPSAKKLIASFGSYIPVFNNKCPYCRGNFLKGVFFSSGRISDPEKQYSLEFSPADGVEKLSSLLEGVGLSPRISKKKNETLIYFRNSGEIEDFFALCGMNSTAFSIMNKKIHAEIRNNANRIANCETNNIGKAVNSSVKLIMLIEALIDKGLISQLPDELITTARLRLEYRDLSIAQLANLFTPKISKPGLSHRLNRITETAETLLKEKK